MKDILKSNSLCSSEGWQRLAQELLQRLTIEIERATLRENNLESNIQSINSILNNFYNKSEIVELLGLLNIIIEDVVALGNSNAVTSNAVALALADKVFYININIKPNTEDRILSNKTSLEIKEAVNAGKTLLISGAFPSLGTSLQVLDPISPTPSVKVLAIDNLNSLYVITVDSLGEGYILKINLEVDNLLNGTSVNAISNLAVTVALLNISKDWLVLRFNGILKDPIHIDNDVTSEVQGGVYYSEVNNLFVKDSGLVDSYSTNWEAYSVYQGSDVYNGTNGSAIRKNLYAIVTDKLDLYMYSLSEETLVNINDYIINTISQLRTSTNASLRNLQPLVGTVTHFRTSGTSFVGDCDLSPADVLTALAGGQLVVLNEEDYLKGAMQILYAYSGENSSDSLNMTAGGLCYIGNKLYHIDLFTEADNMDWNILFVPIENSSSPIAEIPSNNLIFISLYTDESEPYGGDDGDFALQDLGNGAYNIWHNEDDDWVMLTENQLNKAIIIYDNNLYRYNIQGLLEDVLTTEVDLDNYIQYGYLPFTDVIDDEEEDSAISISAETYNGVVLGNIYFSPIRNKFLFTDGNNYYLNWTTKKFTGNGVVVRQRLASDYYNDKRYKYIFVNSTTKEAYVYLSNTLFKIGGNSVTQLSTLPKVRKLTLVTSTRLIPSDVEGFYKVLIDGEGFRIYERDGEGNLLLHNKDTLPPMYFVYNDSLMKWENGTLLEETPDLFARDENAANILKIDEFINVNIVRVALLTVQSPGDIVYNKNTNKFYLRYQVNDSYNYANAWVSTDNIKGSIYYNNNEGYPKENNLYYYINTNSDLNETSFYVSDGTELKLYTENKGAILVKYWLRESDYNLGGLNQTLLEGEYAYYWYTTRDEEEYGVLVTKYKGEILEVTNPNQHCIYISEPKNSIYRWDGQKMVFISGSNDPLANIPVVTVIGENTTTQPPQNTAGMIPGYYVYLNGGNKMTLYLLRNNRWIQVPDDAIMYVIWNGKLFLYLNGEFLNGQSIREIYYNQDDTMEDEDYYIDTEEMKIYQYIEGESPEDVTESLSSVYKYNNILYITNSAGILEKVNNEGLAPANVDVDNLLNTTSTNPVENRVIATKFSEVDEALTTISNAITANTEEILNINKEDYRKNSDEEDIKLYPEYWFDVIEQEKNTADPTYEKKSIVYAKNYYDWNTVWYKDTIENSGATGTLNADVIYPTEYLNTALKWVRGLKDTISTRKKLMAEDVYFDSTLNLFVILFNGTYYTKWNNSYLWNNESEGVIVQEHPLRSDTVYCRIVPGVYLGKTSTKVINNVQYYTPYYQAMTQVVVSGVLTSIFDTFTDFKEAIARCKNENAGNVCFHSTKIYGFIPSGRDEYRWTSMSDFIINGQGATICAVGKIFIEPEDISDDESLYPTRVVTFPTADTNWSRNTDNVLGNVIHIRNCELFTIQNLKIKAVKNCIKNSASNYVFSFSSGYTWAIHLLSCSDIIIKDVEFSGCSKDIEVKVASSGDTFQSCNKMVVDGWKSDCSGGIDGGSILTLLISNSYVKTDPYIGAHMLYFFGTVRSLTCRNCSFIQDTMFNTNFIQVKQASAPTSAENIWSTVKHVFENCYFLYARGIIYYTPYYLYNIIFKQCTFMLTTKKYNGAICFWNGYRPESIAGAGNAAITLNDPANVQLDGCSLTMFGKFYYMKVDPKITSTGGTGAFWSEKGLGSNPDLEPFHIVITNSYIRYLDKENISNYAYGGKVFDTNYSYYSKYIENNESNINLPASNGRYSFNMENIGVKVDDTLKKKSKNPVLNAVISNVINDVNVSLYGVPLEYTQGSLDMIPKSAEVGDVYYATDEEKYFKCVHLGGQSKVRFSVTRNVIEGVDFIIKGRLRVFMGMNDTDYLNATDAIKNKLCILDVNLDSTLEDDLDISTNVKLSLWIVEQINNLYPDFIYGYSTSTRGIASKHSNSDSNFNILTYGGFSCKENVVHAVTRTGYVFALYEPDSGIQSMMTISRATANESSHYTPANTAWSGTKNNIDAIIHQDSQNTDMRFADHHLTDEDIEHINSYLTDVVVLTNNAYYYYLFGFDAIWEDMSFDGGINGRLKNIEDDLTMKKSIVTEVALWNDNYQQKSDWSKGDYWYAPTDRELKICVSEQVDFENAAPCIVSHAANLYFWDGLNLYSITLGTL